MSKFIETGVVDKISDYFMDWIDGNKYNIKIIKTPTRYKAGYSSRITGKVLTLIMDQVKKKGKSAYMRMIL